MRTGGSPRGNCPVSTMVLISGCLKLSCFLFAQKPAIRGCTEALDWLCGGYPGTVFWIPVWFCKRLFRAFLRAHGWADSWVCRRGCDGFPCSPLRIQNRLLRRQTGGRQLLQGRKGARNPPPVHRAGLDVDAGVKDEMPTKIYFYGFAEWTGLDVMHNFLNHFYFISK